MILIIITLCLNKFVIINTSINLNYNSCTLHTYILISIIYLFSLRLKTYIILIQLMYI